MRRDLVARAALPRPAHASRSSSWPRSRPAGSSWRSGSTRSSSAPAALVARPRARSAARIRARRPLRRRRGRRASAQRHRRASAASSTRSRSASRARSTSTTASPRDSARSRPACSRSRRRSRSTRARMRRAQSSATTTWELVRPDRPPPEDRLARGHPAARSSTRVVDALEASDGADTRPGALGATCSTRSSGRSSASASRSSSCFSGFLADGHVLLEDYPGLAKTLAARSFAQVLSMRFARIQFTPDLMPSDVTGSSIWNQRDGDFEFRPGPIFTNLLLADEINRAPPKTQAALLEAMQERQVDDRGRDAPLEPPFLVIATQNPIEYEGTYPLPEAQLDRFLLRTAFGYPSREDEVEVLGATHRARVRRRRAPSRRRSRDAARDAGGRRERLRRDERAGVLRRPRRRDAHVAELRPSERARAGASRCSSSPAAGPRSDGRDFVLPDDVKAVAVPALAHRLVLRPELWVQRVSAEDVVRDVLETRPDAARGGRRRRRPLVTRTGSPRVIGLRGARGDRAASPRSRSADRSSRSSPRRSRSCSRRHARRARSRRRGRARRSPPSGRSRRPRSTRSSRSVPGAPVDRLELLLELPPAVEVVDGRRRPQPPPPSGRGARARLRAPLHALGRASSSVASTCAPATRSGSSSGRRVRASRTA